MDNKLPTFSEPTIFQKKRCLCKNIGNNLGKDMTQSRGDIETSGVKGSGGCTGPHYKVGYEVSAEK